MPRTRVEEHQWRQFVEIMGTPEWAEMELFENRLARGANFDALQAFLQDWCREQSVDELYHAAQQRRVPFAPVSTMGDLVRSPHLEARAHADAMACLRRGRGERHRRCRHRHAVRTRR